MQNKVFEHGLHICMHLLSTADSNFMAQLFSLNSHTCHCQMYAAIPARFHKTSAETACPLPALLV